MAQAKRRVPYSMGPDKLGPERSPLKESLTEAEDAKLSGDIRELFDRLQPSPESEERRKKLVEKLEKILNDTWPGHSIKVNVFGSTGNRLGTTDSDVDICITTDLKELEHVCSLAELLANHGMERVVCVSSAKVPIVKIWDPELRLACDMNVNNPIALENTEMIRTYVGIDPRVRPLAMIIKYWTKRRILNEPGMSDQITCGPLWLTLLKHSARL
jgi:DNA polymerase sigma